MLSSFICEFDHIIIELQQLGRQYDMESTDVNSDDEDHPHSSKHSGGN
jgi:hypothetical protein